ncbi:DUF4258 domain-containing protein [Rhodohalobacter sulfatireducens]|uniref:DUF4258 domain-containing protein n=1 Tax=Rhodohalobacter sulfatireducens TaxID=2911366 RepID=UPI0034E25E34
MKLFDEIHKKVIHNQFEFSRHAVDQSIIRNISVQEVKQAINKEAKIIEDYPNDKCGPSCLILGLTKQNRPLHIQCSYPSRPVLKIITLYEPDPEKWINFEKRRNP